MPIHDWTQVGAGIFHDFHHGWIEEIKRALNNGLLPTDYYAIAEQIIGHLGPDVLTLRTPGFAALPTPTHEPAGGGVAVAQRPPKARFHVKAESDLYSEKAKAVVVRHSSDHQVIA